MERQVKGIWIPIEIWENKELTWNEKILFLDIDSFTSKNMDCFISNEHISKLLGVNETSANRILSSLIKKGYVIKTKFDGRKRYVKSALHYSISQPYDLAQPCIANCDNIPNTLNNKDYIIPPTPPKGEESDKKDPSKKINKEARKIFEEHFNDIFSENYYWTAKDAGSMSKLLGKLKYSRKQKNLPVDDDSVLYALKYFLSQINEGWIFENFSVTNINSKFNEIISQIYSSNGKNKNFSKQRANEAALQQLLSAKEKIGVVDEATKPF